ncbi:NADP-dependent isocitrate dehydrogenase [Candidatus Marithrix sp. Canyon 246]|uniref:NADP-dependent isocitrate dehydrogenase n=1 Tax=Candidatus Marithrix sp. Canyon 246 TaxID=1827136 RepID=UPI00084A1D8A|nr:NADP-dependent isocitrate dehydrogenase [Candidatus Marithrix sp. Canyon 246]
MSQITWTQTDEAPAMASYSFLPIVQAFTKSADIEVKTRDISLAARVIALFPERLEAEQRIDNELQKLGDLAKTPVANIIKLPNISASVPQLKAVIAELQSKGYKIPDFSENPQTDEEKAIREKYTTVLGSAVNPVLREGNSDRRAPSAVKNYAKKFPHSMGEWLSSSKSHVATMSAGDFRSNEKSITMGENTEAKITFRGQDGNEIVLKEAVPLETGEVVDATFMSKKALVQFLETQLEDAKDKGVLFSLHMKATMMKVSDPIIFGHAVKVFFADVINKHAETLEQLNVNFNNGFGDLYNKIESLPAEIEADIQKIYASRADVAMVDSHKGITNLHVPSDVIIDASMPAAIRAGGKMWNKNDELQDTKFIIPDSSYAPLYDETIKNCIANGALDPRKMGTVPNVGLMAKKAEEYGSHPTTFEVPADGSIMVTDAKGNTIHEQVVEEGDIWRLVRVKDESIRDWVKLAVNRAQKSGWKTIFWLDEDREHHIELRKKVDEYLKDYDISGLDIEIMPVKDAARVSIERIRAGENTISVTGNVLRDYNTDLYPILEVGTSAKMLSIVPLMAGGGLFETGAGGSAPKHVQQLLKDNYLRWDSLGEFLALVPSLEQVAALDNNVRAKILANALDKATEKLLENNKSPQRKLGTIDNRGSHFYLAMYWAEAVAKQTEDAELASKFAEVFKNLAENEETINQELLSVQKQAVDLGGYYKHDFENVSAVMRPSKTFNDVIDNI